MDEIVCVPGSPGYGQLGQCPTRAMCPSERPVNQGNQNKLYGNPNPIPSKQPAPLKCHPATFIFSGTLAHRCLLSMPIEPPKAISLITEYRKYPNFTHRSKPSKNCPGTTRCSRQTSWADWTGSRRRRDRAGIVASLSLIRSFLGLKSANDGHLPINACSTNGFQFTHREPLVEVSVDGVEVSDVYTLRMFTCSRYGIC